LIDGLSEVEHQIVDVELIISSPILQSSFEYQYMPSILIISFPVIFSYRDILLHAGILLL
jgi:hypothetical protein